MFPLTPIYGIIIRLRNFLFNKNIFKSVKVNVPVISIGNLTIGGSGKTPTTIYITNLLRSNGFKPGVLSRGYGRKSKGYLLVANNGNEINDVEKCGDEILQTIAECKVPAAVSENRVRGASRFLKETEIDSIILDDAFQHRWIYRDLDILLFEQRLLIANNKLRRMLLPTGNMREQFDSTKRADVVILNRKFSAKEELPVEFERLFDNKRVFTAYYESVGFVDVKTHSFYKPEEFVGQKSLVISGIANPVSFLNALKKMNVETANHLIFRDHKFYTKEDIQNIRKKFYDLNTHSVITTQKDAVRLYPFSNEFDDVDIYYLKIELKFDKQKEFDEFVLSRISKGLKMFFNNNTKQNNIN